MADGGPEEDRHDGSDTPPASPRRTLPAPELDEDRVLSAARNHYVHSPAGRYESGLMVPLFTGPMPASCVHLMPVASLAAFCASRPMHTGPVNAAAVQRLRTQLWRSHEIGRVDWVGLDFGQMEQVVQFWGNIDNASVHQAAVRMFTACRMASRGEDLNAPTWVASRSSHYSALALRLMLDQFPVGEDGELAERATWALFARSYPLLDSQAEQQCPHVPDSPISWPSRWNPERMTGRARRVLDREVFNVAAGFSSVAEAVDGVVRELAQSWVRGFLQDNLSVILGDVLRVTQQPERQEARVSVKKERCREFDHPCKPDAYRIVSVETGSWGARTKIVHGIVWGEAAADAMVDALAPIVSDERRQAAARARPSRARQRRAAAEVTAEVTAEAVPAANVAEQANTR